MRKEFKQGMKQLKGSNAKPTWEIDRLKDEFLDKKKKKRRIVKNLEVKIRVESQFGAS